jgi:hypothetical protein
VESLEAGFPPLFLSDFFRRDKNEISGLLQNMRKNALQVLTENIKIVNIKIRCGLAIEFCK